MAEGRDSLRSWAGDLALTGIIGLFLGVLGPFGSYFNGPAWQRIAYWMVSVWAGTFVFGGVVRLVMRRPAAWPRTALILTLVVVGIAVPFAWANRLFALALWPAIPQLRAIAPLVWYLEVLVISAPQVLAFAWLQRRVEPTRPRPAGDSALPPSEGLLGAPPAEVLCLAMEDHYVRVHTPGGSRLVLATLAQAIAALKGARGLQVHRSWWVADAAVEAAEADGRNLRLRLKGGLTAPVARSAVAAVRAAGWLDRAHPTQAPRSA